MTTYYVANGGNDAADGLTESTPWASVTFVNTQASTGRIGKNDVVLFRRGHTFYAKLVTTSGLSSITPGRVTYGAYGSSGQNRRPIISSYKILNTSGGWTNQGSNNWSVDLSNANAGVTHTGYAGLQGGGTNIGFLKVDGRIYGKRVWNLTDLATPWDFYCSGNLLYVRASVNPTSLAADIRASTDQPCVQGNTAAALIGLRFEGGGGQGFDATGAASVRIFDCEFAEIGGSLLTGTTRYGNGVQLWQGAADVVVERNEFHDIYDAALTAQGGTTGSSAFTWTDIAFRSNLIYRCEQSIELWARGTSSGSNGFRNVLVEDNVCLFSGRSWSSSVRPDQGVGVSLLTYGWELDGDVVVRGNVFYDARTAYRYSAFTPTGMLCTGNHIFQRAGSLLRAQTTHTVEQWQGWTAVEGNDVDSRFYALPVSVPVDLSGALQQIIAQSGSAVAQMEAVHRAVDRTRGEVELVRAALTTKTDLTIATNAQTGTTYTLALLDAGKVVELNNASTVTVTIPPDNNAPFPIGARLWLCRLGAGTVTVAPGAGVTLRAPSGASLTTQYATAELRKRATGEWVLSP